MLHVRPSRSPIGRSLSAVAAVVILSFALSACNDADPLAAIREQQEAGGFSGTVEPLRELVAERPGDAEVNFLYGKALQATGYASLATWSLREAMDDPDWLIPAGMQLARGSLTTGDFNEVVEVTTRILESHPDHTLALLFRAQANAHWRKDPTAALTDAQRVLELEPETVEAYEPLILALLALDRHEEASEALAEAGRRLEASDAPASSLAWHCSTTAIFADEGGEPERAREKWSECLEKYPANPTVVSNALQFYDAKGEWQRSLEALRRAQAEMPEDRTYRVGLAERLRRMGEAAEGEALLREATEAEQAQTAANAWVDLAQYRHAMGEHGAAADALGRAVERVREFEEPSSQLLFQYADTLVIAGWLERAMQIAKEITVPAQRHMILGRIAQERGDPADALKEFDEALRVWPDNPWARYYAALAAERLGDFDRALEEYRYAIRISVGATDARTRAARLLIAENKSPLAYQLLFLQIAEAPLDPDGELLSYYLQARVANPKQLQSALTELRTRNPARLPSALAHSARGAAEAAGPGAALRLLIGAPGVQYADPRSAPALREIVRLAHEAGDPGLAQQVVDAALAASPEAAVFHEIRGLHLELAGAAPDEVRAAYERAVALDPGNAGSQAGLGRLTLESDPDAAAAYFDLAAAADPEDPSAKLGAARALRASGKLDEARERLEALLVAHPLEAAAAAEVVSLDLERGVATSSTLERALRAVRFGGGADALELLSRTYEMRKEPALAAKAAERARALREARPPEG